METTALYIVEEHHEAFLAWHHALKQNRFQAVRKNTLLHVDYHADMKTFPHRQPIPDLSASLSAMQGFTYNELMIASFIIPAVYQKLFYDVCWLVPKTMDMTKNNIALNEKKYFYARTYKTNKKDLIVKEDPFQGFSDKPWQDRVPFCYYCQTVEHPFSSEASVILDIDLDYFACSKMIDASQRLEITRAEFERCQTERYRKLNLFFNYSVEESDGHYYICFNEKPEIFDEYQETFSEEKISLAIEELILFLQHNTVIPVCITICRSRYSGYTPQNAWEFIEQRLLAKLRELYSFEPLYIQQMN